MARIDAFLKLGREQSCSDIHLAVGVPPMFRMHGDLMPIKFRNLGDSELEGYMSEILSKSQKEKFRQGNDLDFSYMSDGAGRFRINLFRKSSGIGATFRHIPTEIPAFDNLDLPPIIKTFADYKQGMVLLTGSTGTGKSTTLASLINYINKTRKENIITLEDPIEFIHPSLKSQVIQREVGTHVKSFSDGLRASLREDPDIILVGEMRDSETITMAMLAAETGHLVFGTLHTTSATKSLDRIIDALPAEQQGQGKIFLSQNLHAVVTQDLVKTIDGRRRKAIVEIMMVNNAISNLIMSDKTFQIPNQIQTGSAVGMQLKDQALLAAIHAKEVDPDDAYLHANDKKLLQRFVTDPSLLPKSD
ncbi:MAG: PilT/PilU family type 4a pilus ATPase [Gammaproteobacteria bacterium]|nr:PilT/PilU family type 4a pilus ATPase [Gammaproteobacteria bacterium]